MFQQAEQQPLPVLSRTSQIPKQRAAFGASQRRLAAGLRQPGGDDPRQA
jgi:hypothetical protein